LSNDAVGNLTERIDRLGRKTVWEYDSLDRGTAEKWYDGASLVRTLSYSYDAAGQLLSAADPAAAYEFEYNLLGRLTSELQSLTGLAFDIAYQSEFDANSRRTQLLSLLGGQADFANTYLYDNLNRLTVLTQESGGSGPGANVVAEKRVDFAYNAASQFSKISRYADWGGFELVANTFYAYDGIGRLSSLIHSTDSEPPLPVEGWGEGALAGYEFTYDAASRITAINSFADGFSGFDYDNTDQLTAAGHTGQPDETYTYDENGNRTMSGYSTTDNNQLTTDGIYSYTYDDEGNRLSKTRISTGEKEEYAWDHRNRLTKVTFKDSSGTVTKTVDQTYDVFNRWIKRSVDADGPASGAAADTFFSWEANQINLQFDSEGDLTHRYLWNPAAVDHVFAVENVLSLMSAGEVLWLLTDHLGTPRDLASYDDSTDEITIENHRVFNSFGILTSETNASFTTLVGFTGVFFDISTSLNYHRARWLDLPTGRWMSEDPIGFAGGDQNLQRYVGNSPTIFIDPTGLIVAGDGHHLVNQANWVGMSTEVQKVFDSPDARIRNEFYKFHDGSTVNGITHDCYNQEVGKELSKFLNGRKPSSMTPQDAANFLEVIKNSKNKIIVDFNKGVKAEAHAAYEIGKAAYDAAGGKANKNAYEIGVREAGKAVAATRRQINETAAKRLGRTFGRRLLGLLPFVSSGVVLCTTGDVNAAGREAFLELTGLDTPRDLALIAGDGFDYAVSEIDRTAEIMSRPEWPPPRKNLP
jgi:RHS repeat-associated protein